MRFSLILTLLVGPLLAQQIPPQMSECEAGSCKGTWTFNGQIGSGRWSNGTSAQLRVERYGADGVVIRRTDTSGPTVGLTAVYSP